MHVQACHALCMHVQPDTDRSMIQARKPVEQCHLIKEAG